MNKLATILSAISLLAVGVLAVVVTKKGGSTKPKVINTASGVVQAGARFAYVDMDTLENSYGEFKKKKAEFEAQDKNLGTEIERTMGGIQRDALELQKKAQEGKVNQQEYESGMRALESRQQQLEIKKQNEATALIKKQEEFNTKLQKDLHTFLEGYAQDNGYDYVLAYTKNGSILFADQSNNITKDVLDALNGGKIKTTKEDVAVKKEDKDVKK